MESINHYAQIDAAGVCVGLLQTPGTVEADHMISIEPGAARLGQRWTGTAWENVAPMAAQQALQDLQRIDADTGMPRAMREAFIAMADKLGVDVAFLKAQEAKAATARARLKG